VVVNLLMMDHRDDDVECDDDDVVELSLVRESTDVHLTNHHVYHLHSCQLFPSALR